jgi:hypothetical protein
METHLKPLVERPSATAADAATFPDGRRNVSCRDCPPRVSFAPAVGPSRGPRAREPASLSVATRLLLIVCGGGLVCLLTLAAWLEPDPRGLGTHQRLGLPPCTFQVLFAVRCPSCGMTTAWAHLVRGQIGAACRANVGGLLVGLVSLLLGPWTLLSGLSGRWLGPAIRAPVAAWAAVLVLGVTLTDWWVRLLIDR